jgi:protein phosphatase 1 regulatory subunit 10
LKDTPPTPPITTPPAKSPDEQKPVVFNFYRDTLVDNEEMKKNEEKEDENEKSNSSNDNEDDIDIPMDSFVPGVGEGLLKSALVIHRSKNKPKKTVRWIEEEELKKFHFFEMDETERVNVTRIARNFTEMKQIERSEERKVLKRNLRKDNMEEKTPWVTPSKIIFTTPPHETGTYSQEAITQDERERTILEVVYFSKTQIPDSAGEPDEPPIRNQDDPAVLK